LALTFGLPAAAQNVSADATFGEVVPLGGTPSDLVVDEGRGLLYLINSNANRVDLLNYRTRQLVGSIPVCSFPLSGAMSPDAATLYVTCTQGASMAIIRLGANQVQEFVSLPARPEGVAVGFDGRVLITTQGVGINNASNTLLLYDPSQDAASRVYIVPSPPAISTPNPLPAVTAGRPATAFPGRLLATPDGRFIIGMVAINQQLNSAITTVFVYEAASATVLRNRLVTGQSTVLSFSGDGGRFMAGFTQYDTATLAVNGQFSIANLPFFLNTGFSQNFNAQFNFGGSVFSPDGQTLYSAFNNSTATTFQNLRPTSNILMVSNPRNLSTTLGIRLRESVLGRMVITSDGADIFALSESGLLYIPISKLFDSPIIQPEATQVFLAVDDCNRGIARASVGIANLGKGKLTFAVPNTGAALVAQVASGVAPSRISFVMEPGRAGVVRQAGTNLYTGAATNQGGIVSVQVVAPEAINLPNVIRVYMNFRESTQRGLIFPIPTTPNLFPAGSSIPEGLWDMALDEARGRLYISNSGFNRIEIFDINRQRLMDPIEVGQMPHSLAMSPDGLTLWVGNYGGESIQAIDLDTLRITGSIEFPPIPRAGAQALLRPVAMAYGISGLQFMMAANSGTGTGGSFWRVVGNQAVPRQNVNGFPPATIPGPHYMAATPDGRQIVVMNGNGVGYLYDGLADTYINSRQIWNLPPPISYYGPLAAGAGSSYFLAGGLILSPALSPVGGAERPGTVTFSPPPAPGLPPQQTIVSAGQRNVNAVLPLNEASMLRLTTPVRQNIATATRDDARTTLERVDLRSGSEQIAAVIPDNPFSQVFGTARSNVPPRQMVADSKGNVYILTLSGLVVTPISPTNTSTQPALPLGVRAVVNSADGTQVYRPGSFVTISGANLAGAATAETVPPPTVLGGSCVTMNDVPLPLLQTAPNRISAQIPADVRPGQNVLRIRSHANAQSSEPLVITVQRP
jgi:DNA-binding beta-propeller fold protein YncE